MLQTGIENILFISSLKYLFFQVILIIIVPIIVGIYIHIYLYNYGLNRCKVYYVILVFYTIIQNHKRYCTFFIFNSIMINQDINLTITFTLFNIS